jgi:excisionase family DNA binding protein
MAEELISIGEAAEMLDVSVDTLRRWDESGKLKAVRSAGGHRNYRKHDIEIFLSDLYKMAQDWVSTSEASELPKTYYCPTSSIFQARLEKLQSILGSDQTVGNYFSLLVSVSGEIGNNSFDHNLGNWPDVAGIFFAFDTNKRQIVLADRGLGILHTLKRVKPELMNDAQALEVAFTEIISGRKPEARGNGLKFVRQVAQGYPINLLFLTGNAQVNLLNEDKELKIKDGLTSINGCLALITY